MAGRGFDNISPNGQCGSALHSDGTVTIQVNGEYKQVAAGLSLAGLAREMGLVPEKVAVERNLEVVPRSTLAEVRVEDGDELEIVHFVGGG
jgi:thiazole synthase